MLHSIYAGPNTIISREYADRFKDELICCRKPMILKKIDDLLAIIGHLSSDSRHVAYWKLNKLAKEYALRNKWIQRTCTSKR